MRVVLRAINSRLRQKGYVLWLPLFTMLFFVKKKKKALSSQLQCREFRVCISRSRTNLHAQGLMAWSQWQLPISGCCGGEGCELAEALFS